MCVVARSQRWYLLSVRHVCAVVSSSSLCVGQRTHLRLIIRDVTEGGRQQQQGLNETWALANL